LYFAFLCQALVEEFIERARSSARAAPVLPAGLYGTNSNERKTNDEQTQNLNEHRTKLARDGGTPINA
jgi:hypothetical protein